MKKSILLLTLNAMIFQGCAVTPQEIVDQKNRVHDEITTVQGKADYRLSLQQGLVVEVQAPYLSGKKVPLSKQAHLPLVFSKSSAFVRPASGEAFTIPKVGELITRSMGIRVRVRPDVFLPANALIPGSASATTTSTNNSPPMMVGGQANASSDYDNRVDYDFTGSLADYLDRIRSRTGINWEWNAVDQELVLFRLIRKTFTLDTAPSAMTVSSTVSKGSSASTGASSSGSGGSTGGGASGTIAGNSQTSLTMSMDAWTATVNTLKRLSTKSGVVEANPSTRTITVIDTRDVVIDAEKFMAQQNEILNRQVLLNVRLVTVALNRKNQFDFDLNVALQKFISAGNPAWTLNAIGAGKLTDTNAGSLTYAVVDPSAKLTGSQAIAQALNEIGDVVNEYTQTVPVRNNHSIPLSDFSSFAYLASTTPGTSSSTGSSSSSGVGLNPGTVTSGTTMVLTPSILSGERLSLLLSLDRSSDPTFQTISAGSGATLQTIQLPQQSGVKIDTEVAMTNGRTLVLMGLNKDNGSNVSRNGVLSYGQSTASNRQVQILMVTPQILGDR